MSKTNRRWLLAIALGVGAGIGGVACERTYSRGIINRSALPATRDRILYDIREELREIRKVLESQ